MDFYFDKDVILTKEERSTWQIEKLEKVSTTIIDITVFNTFGNLLSMTVLTAIESASVDEDSPDLWTFWVSED